ncbi:MAG: CBS domain-containing protein [Bdellovibrionota bacterium]
MKNSLMPSQSRIWSVRADLSIMECVRILRDRSVGALVVLSDDAKEEIVGIFTERDLVKNFELIRNGGFWDTPVRTVMTTNVHTITAAQISQAPRLMARYHIRHLPVVKVEKGRTRLVGVISMRDVFRLVMEEFDYDLEKAYLPPVAGAGSKPKKKVMAIFSADPAITELMEKGANLTRHLLVQAAPLREEFENLPGILARFDALFIDLDELRPVELAKVLAVAKAAGKEDLLFLAFNPTKLEPKILEELRGVSSRKRVHLLSKPVALGLLYEKFLRAA